MIEIYRKRPFSATLENRFERFHHPEEPWQGSFAAWIASLCPDPGTQFLLTTGTHAYLYEVQRVHEEPLPPPPIRVVRI